MSSKAHELYQVIAAWDINDLEELLGDVQMLLEARHEDGSENDDG